MRDEIKESLRIQHGIAETLTDAEIQQDYPAPYGLGYPDKKAIWDAIRKHPLFGQIIRDHVADIDRQIASVGTAPTIKTKMRGALTGLGDLMRAAKQIAADVGRRR